MNYFRKTLERISDITSAFPFVELSDQIEIIASSDILIDKVVYQTWIDKKLPRNLHRSISNFRSQNQDFKFILYTDAEVNEYMYEFWRHHPIYSIYKENDIGPLKADIWRYCKLYDAGGFYIDIKSGFSLPIHEIVNCNATLFVTNENNKCGFDDGNNNNENIELPHNLFAQWAFGCIKGSKFLELLIEKIPEEFEQLIANNDLRGKRLVLETTGPIMFSRIMRHYLCNTLDDGVQQCGIDFNGLGLYNLKHANARFLQKKSYSKKAFSLVSAHR